MLDVSLLVLQALTVALMIGAVAIWAVVLKETISLFLESFGLKKTAVVATMALVLLSGATAMAGEAIVQIEDGNLVYYAKTKEIPNVPKGITAEQAQQLVDGVVPSVTFSDEKAGYRFGLSVTRIKTDTTVSFRGGWILKEVSDESLSIFSLFLLVAILFYSFFMAYFEERGMVFFLVVAFFILIIDVVLLGGRGEFTEIGVLAALSFLGGFLGWSLRVRRKKKQNAESHVLEVETVLEIET